MKQCHISMRKQFTFCCYIVEIIYDNVTYYILPPEGGEYPLSTGCFSTEALIALCAGYFFLVQDTDHLHPFPH